MKRYWLFAGDCYYAAGGWRDFRGDFETPGEAVRRGMEGDCGHAYEWWHVLDSHTGELVTASAERAYCG